MRNALLDSGRRQGRTRSANAIAATEHHLKALREISSAPLPGQSLVVLDPSLMLAVDVFACEDGHAQERSLFDEVLPTMEVSGFEPLTSAMPLQRSTN